MSTFDLKAFDAVMEKIRDLGPPPGPIYASREVGDSLAYGFQPLVGRTKETVRALGGVPIYKSDMFPMDLECGTCGGTGEGADSTYCNRCRGTGTVRYEGFMNSGRDMVLLTGRAALPKKFQPRFPAGLVPQPPLTKGLP